MARYFVMDYKIISIITNLAAIVELYLFTPLIKQKINTLEMKGTQNSLETIAQSDWTQRWFPGHKVWDVLTWGYICIKGKEQEDSAWIIKKEQKEQCLENRKRKQEWEDLGMHCNCLHKVDLVIWVTFLYVWIFLERSLYFRSYEVKEKMTPSIF